VGALSAAADSPDHGQRGGAGKRGKRCQCSAFLDLRAARGGVGGQLHAARLIGVDARCLAGFQPAREILRELRGLFAAALREFTFQARESGGPIGFAHVPRKVQARRAALRIERLRLRLAHRDVGAAFTGQRQWRGELQFVLACAGVPVDPVGQHTGGE
jgi:hypothetical protein